MFNLFDTVTKVTFNLYSELLFLTRSLNSSERQDEGSFQIRVCKEVSVVICHDPQGDEEVRVRKNQRRWSDVRLLLPYIRGNDHRLGSYIDGRRSNLLNWT